MDIKNAIRNSWVSPIRTASLCDAELTYYVESVTRSNETKRTTTFVKAVKHAICSDDRTLAFASSPFSVVDYVTSVPVEGTPFSIVV